MNKSESENVLINRLKALAVLFLSVFTFSTAQVVLAADPAPTPAATTIIPKKIEGKDLTDEQEARNELAESFRTGQFELYNLGTYVQYLIELLIYFAAGISVLFIVIGGYQYMIGSISDDKEAGKKTISYALGGLAISILAWTIVNVVQVWLTSGN